jgi:hypothetical protein
MIFMVQLHITRAEKWKKRKSLNVAHPHKKEKKEEEQCGTELPENSETTKQIYCRVKRSLP